MENTSTDHRGFDPVEVRTQLMNKDKGFFDINKDKKDSLIDVIPTEKDIEIAKSLLYKLSKKGLLNSRRSSVSSWSRHIAALHAHDGYDPSVVYETAKYYLLHLGEKYVPQAFSGRSFRRKFVDIQRTISRISGKDPDQATLVVSEKALELKKELEEFLPENHPNDLPILIQKSINNARDLLKRLDSLRSSQLGFPITQYLEIIKDYIPESPELIAEEWFNGIVEKYMFWEEWSGKLYVFSIDSKRLCQFGVIADLVSSEGREIWDELLPLIITLED